MNRNLLLLFLLSFASLQSDAFGQDRAQKVEPLAKRLLAEPADKLIEDATKLGDPARGAVAFYQPNMNCAKCHDASSRRLGPDLSKQRDVTIAHLIESVLKPSANIHEGFETVQIALDDGRVVSGVLVEETETSLVIDSIENAATSEISKETIEEWARSKTSSMPVDLANQLSDRQQFLDLISFLNAIVGKPDVMKRLKPLSAAIAPLPEYESRVDHAGLIRSLDQASFERGEETYRLRCASCHGTLAEEGSMPTSLRFGSGKFKHGSDPFVMYQTLTHGFGMMNPQRWMVPQQKYEVIHYIREQFLKEHNQTQLFEITDAFLAGLPKGDTRGPKPVVSRPWTTMNYGPSMFNTIEVSNDGSNIAQKGIVVRLDSGPGGVESGSHWMMYEHDTMRVAGAWSDKFIDWEGIHFNGTHGRHPKATGDIHFANATGPGFGRPGESTSDAFKDDRVIGRDGKHYGPLPKEWVKYEGMYRFGDKSIINYRVGNTEVLETPNLTFIDQVPVYHRHINLGARTESMVIQIADVQGAFQTEGGLAIVADKASDDLSESKLSDGLNFDGTTFGEVASGDRFDMSESDYSIYAQIKTKSDGTIFSKTKNRDEWVPQGKAFFLRGGRPTFDIGWVGAVQADRRVDDGKWHDVVMTWNVKEKLARFYVDGELAGEDEIAPKKELAKSVVRIGFTNGNFPATPFFDGSMEEVRFYQRELAADELGDPSTIKATQLIGVWKSQSQSTFVEARGKADLNAEVSGTGKSLKTDTGLIAHCSLKEATWNHEDENLRLTIPPGEAVDFVISHAPARNLEHANELKEKISENANPQDLRRLTSGGPANYPQILQTRIIRGDESGPFAVDVFERPKDNPWNCQLRLTGIDFIGDGDTAIVSAWDGSVWKVSGFLDPENHTLSWKRFAAGLFQPLGVKCLDDQIYVICRDQLVRLHDLNDDDEADWYENFNSDHQVTEHFHEFAMGLQTDDKGNFYYAKSARHAKKAVVPHHGTLLKVSADGKRTEIIANGFRAANGVCINGDGSFVVTDQEGHWNPKNRINWVRPGEFYGNMFGYHDVKDDSDSAMQDPLCWITNEFDRSPGELLWVTSKKWGPLYGSLLNFSYGYGKVYVVPHETVDGKVQGGMCEFPLPQFPTGVMRGRFHPEDGQLYCCGMFAWAGSQHQPGGLYRIRYTENPVHLPVGLSASKKRLQIKFSGNVDAESVRDLSNFSITTWGLKRTAHYGSKHYNERTLKIDGVKILDDQKTVEVSVPEIQPTWGMEIKYDIKTEDGNPLSGRIHNSIFKLNE